MRLSDVMGASGLHGYAEAALILFMLAFALILLRVFWPSARADRRYRELSQIPFQDGGPGSPGRAPSHPGDES